MKKMKKNVVDRVRKNKDTTRAQSKMWYRGGELGGRKRRVGNQGSTLSLTHH